MEYGGFRCFPLKPFVMKTSESNLPSVVLSLYQFLLEGFHLCCLLFILPWQFKNKYDSHDKANFECPSWVSVSVEVSLICVYYCASAGFIHFAQGRNTTKLFISENMAMFFSLVQMEIQYMMCLCVFFPAIRIHELPILGLIRADDGIETVDTSPAEGSIGSLCPPPFWCGEVSENYK